jgi:4-amino-4-deoxy-L-arabinose transferase-like glycosyltransferase
MNKVEVIIAAIVSAVVLDLGLMYLWGRLSDQDRNIPKVKFLGSYSPFLTWLRFRRLPPLHITVPKLSVHWSLASLSLGLALLLAAISQWMLLKTPDKPGWALMGYAAAVFIFLWAFRKLPSENTATSFSVSLPQGTARRSALVILLFAASVTASFFTVISVDRGNTGPRDYLLIFSWWLSIILYISAILVMAKWHWPSRSSVLAWWYCNRKEFMIVLCLAIAAFAARVIDLPWLPYAMGNDEGQVGLAALQILNGQTTNLFTTSWAAQPSWSFAPNAVMISILGINLTAIRLVSVIYGTLAVVCLYMLAREAFGREVAFLAALGLVGLAWHIHFSRLAFHNIIDSLTAAAALWLTYRALRSGQLTDYLWAGLITGSVVYIYVGSRLVVLLVLGLLAFSWLRRSVRLRTHTIHFLVFAGAAAIMAIPIMTFFLHHSDIFMARMNNAGLLTNGNLETLAINAKQSIPAVLMDQFAKTALVYVTGGAYGHFFNSPRPYLPPLGAVFMILGLAYASWHAREPRYLAVVLWLWMVIIFGGVLTFSPPSHQRLLMSAPAITLLAAIGLWQTARLANHLKIVPYKVGLIVIVIIMGFVSFQGISHYFGEFRLGHYSENPSEEFSQEVSLAVKELGPDYRLVVIGEPTLTIKGHANFGYLAAGIEQLDFNTVTPESLATLPLDKGILFAAIPRRLNDLKKVAQWLPGGKWMDVPRRYQPEQTAYHAYLLSPEAAVSSSSINSANLDPYESVVDSPDGRFSARLRVNWADPQEKPVIELWDNTGTMLWEVPYQFPEVKRLSAMDIYRWAPDSSKVYFYYPYWYEIWYTIFKGSYLQSLDPYTGEIKDVITGCCIDFDFSRDMKKIAYTSEDKVGILDLEAGTDKSTSILPHKFGQSGRVFLSPSGERMIFHTLEQFVGTAIYLNVKTMEQKVIMKDYIIMDYEFDGWTNDENPRYKKGNGILVIDLDTLGQTIVGTATPQP